MKRTIKIITYILIAIVILVFGLLAYFLISNDAPIINGEVSCQVEYKKDLKLDIYWPTNQVYEKRPVIVFFHGGAWITGRKETLNNNRFNDAINQLREKGYVVISPEYTLAMQGKSPFPDCILDAFDVANWIEKNSLEHKFDLSNVGVFGESAGAHIAMMLAYSNKSQFLKDEYFKPRINYIVDVYGPTDLKGIYNNPLINDLNNHIDKLPNNLKGNLDITSQLFGFDPQNDSLKAQEIMRVYSPTNYVNNSSPPILLIHGSDDQLVPIDQSIIFKNKLDSLGVDNKLHILKGMNHGFIGANDTQKEKTQNWIVEFILNNYQRENSLK